MEFDRFTVQLYLLRKDAPELSKTEDEKLLNAHLTHLTKLREIGDLLVAGPIRGEPDREVQGLSIYRVSPERVRELCEQDPMVRAGVYSIQVFPWVVPAGTVRFEATIPKT